MLPWLLFLPIGSTLEPPTSPSVPGTLAAQWRAEHPNHDEPGGYPIFALADVVMRWPTGEALRYPFLAIAARSVGALAIGNPGTVRTGPLSEDQSTDL